ncbi:MAG TPA: hypothetical protein DHD79_01720 [Firmicutes bacterium]|mgnify:FL=1|nr:hypothetical protein [Bacillota bacterium]HBE07341.1 hypothetical protein [Bacillota bacterium]HBG43049.1 hypothetical protein [Bacillota bacterium]HBL49134.1 hypothetical protein [Bacillota bacterium]HBR23921.1 hypothetical protein [Bacillota bacterium]
MANMGIGIELLFLGMGVVFVALIIIIGVMKSLGYFAGANSKKASQTDKIMRRETAGPVSSVTADRTSSADFSGISAKTVAAISGAIAYMMGPGRSGYAIRSIKPCTGRETISPWAIAGRIGLINAGNSMIKRRTSR